MRTEYTRAALALLMMTGLLAAAEDGDATSGTASSSVPAWRIRLLDLGLDARFNYMDRQGGSVTDRGAQYRLRSRTRLDLRRDGQTYIEVRAETGNGFDNSWNNTGLGMGSGQSIFNVKSVAFHQRIGQRFQAQAGGLDFDRGAGTDAIYASGDGVMSGFRAMYTSARSDRLSMTAGYIGDFERPNFFSRLHMHEINYCQFVADKRIAEEVRGSVSIDSIRSTVFGRAALEYGRFWVFRHAIVEGGVRATGPRAFAWSATVSRDWNARWRSDLIYADMPPQFYTVGSERVLFNRGEIDLGRRIAVEWSYRLAKDVHVQWFAGRLLDSAASKRWIAQAGISYDFARMINRHLR